MRLTGIVAMVAGACVALIVGCSSDDGPGAGAGAGDDTSSTLGADASTGTSGTNGTIGSSSGSSGASGSSGGSSGCSGSAADPAAATTVSGFMDKLPFNNPTGPVRAQIIDAIIKSCEVFGPTAAKDPGWDRRYCWAQLVAAINKESGYNAGSTIADGYGTRSTSAGKANDPTVGLLQIRFSSTVRDFATLGNTASLSCAGCTFPASFAAHQNDPGDSAFWAVSGPTQNLATMKDVACNVGLGAWYYYYNASSNGKASAPTYLSAYCGGGGTAGNLVTGLLSHLQGPESGKGVIPNMAGLNALQTTNNGAYQYVTQIKSQFDGMVGAVSGTHPFFLTLVPNKTQYCR
ncbi:hypothetical protein BH11MYX4_BH11MYX4_44880 [soil metagenome]